MRTASCTADSSASCTAGRTASCQVLVQLLVVGVALQVVALRVAGRKSRARRGKREPGEAEAEEDGSATAACPTSGSALALPTPPQHKALLPTIGHPTQQQPLPATHTTHHTKQTPTPVHAAAAPHLMATPAPPTSMSESMARLMTLTSGVNMRCSCCTTSTSSCWCFSALRDFMMRTIAASIACLRSCGVGGRRGEGESRRWGEGAGGGGPERRGWSERVGCCAVRCCAVWNKQPLRLPRPSRTRGGDPSLHTAQPHRAPPPPCPLTLSTSS